METKTVQKLETKNIKLNNIHLKPVKSENEIKTPKSEELTKCIETPKCIILDKEINYII